MPHLEPDFPDGDCVCYEPEDSMYCVCDLKERFVRAYLSGQETSPMTEAQRHWCLDEIERVEGYDRKDYEGEIDFNLARGVLSAWTDYCRDKGLL